MIVDDDEFSIESMKTIFKLCGFNCQYQIDFCANGQESLDRVIEAYENGMTYGIIFTELSMTVLSGIDSTK